MAIGKRVIAGIETFNRYHQNEGVFVCYFAEDFKKIYIMDTALFTWVIIAIVCAVAILYKVMDSLYHHHRKFHRNRIVEIGRESEEFYVPGDRIMKNDYDYDYDD